MLERKIEAARNELRQIVAEYGADNISVAWTGGKDSTVALHMWKDILAEMGVERVTALNIDTGCKFPEVLHQRDTLAQHWGIDLTIVRPEVDISQYPVAQDKISCCAELKVEPLSRGVKEQDIEVLLTGIRKDEHPDRDRPMREQRERPNCLMMHPVLDFSEMDIWAYTMQYNLPYCPLYDSGYRSLGCVPCTKPCSGLGSQAGERAGRDGEKEAKMELLRSLGYF
ncbi:phosphoadenosine phosphosulfate reductase family protein [Halodesulfovibrio aestuarii]|uniref:Phosphoadenosine phosphosulfate reductase family protein n=1 Tax=Halodesulfovibrio aestuarii TaxID=126333 RepID=A0ABV4JQK7_9BACT